jgi:transcriptional repressor NrdR
MRCPLCGHLESRVIDSRPSLEGEAIRRRRECISCSCRFTTYERIEEIPLMVVKKDGRREVFDQNKLLRGLLKACEKRKTSLQTLEDLTESIERDLRNKLQREVSSKEIGEMVMERLRQLDEVAYVRFASVYRQFKDVQDINRFIEELEKNQEKSADR